MAIHRVSKYPDEVFTVTLSFVGQLPASTTISSATLEATARSDGEVDNTVLNDTTPTTTSTTVPIKVQAGTAGESYKIVADVTLSNSDVLQEVMILQVVSP
jgi:hypothetical protein